MANGGEIVIERISIHAALMGCDQATATEILTFPFQSTQPKRAATFQVRLIEECIPDISIHAAQEGCDIYLGYVANPQA